MLLTEQVLGFKFLKFLEKSYWENCMKFQNPAGRRENKTYSLVKKGYLNILKSSYH